MEELNSIDKIFAWYKEMMAERKPIPPAIWVETAMRMNVLVSEIDDEICDLKASIADIAVLCLDEGKSSSEAKIRANSGTLYKRYLRAQAKREQIEEFIRLSKIRARMKDEEFKGY